MPSTLFDKSRPAQSPEIDPSTLSSYKDVSINGTSISLKVDWTSKILSGFVSYSLGLTRPDVSKLVLDTSFLNIKAVSVNGHNVSDFSVSSRVEPLGAALSVPLSSTAVKDGENNLTIEFSTTDECTAVQWLTKEQTSGKVAPYLFSQCQAIHARSLFPCFDTPSVKSSFDIKIQSQYPTVSSGNPTTDSLTAEDKKFFGVSTEGRKVYEFHQHIPIPSYLFAIASGDLASASIGPRSLVYSEPSQVDACKYEFEADTEHFIKTAEKIVFPYDWKTYNVLVLPPSFPYGGMENPNITFATPTLISGDRQNVDVIAHELAHSWSGNLVTNCSWEHFWLNEGWTVYLERRIVGAVHGEAHRHFSAIIGWRDLESSIESMGPMAEQYSRLVVDLHDNKDPDDSFSSVPYEKGFNLLFYLENLVGGKAVFDPFIPFYFTKFKGKSLDTYQFRDTLYEFFADKSELLDSVDWDAWLYKPGLPPKPDFDTSIADACYSLAKRWIVAATEPSSSAFSQFSADDIQSWTSTQAVVFLDAVADGFAALETSTAVAASALDKTYKLSVSNNAEVISRWYRLAVSAKLEDHYQPLADWLGTVGRMKFARTGYRRLNTVDHELAIKTFEKNRLFYHPICRAMISKDLKL